MTFKFIVPIINLSVSCGADAISPEGNGSMEIAIKCHTKDTLALNDLTPFQGDLKNLSESNYQKFKKQILELGFSAPFFVWKHEGKNYIGDGHQRHLTLQQMKKEGIHVPDQLPVVYFEAKDKKEAKKKVLAFTSQYGEMTLEGLSDFAIDGGIEFNEILESFRFPEVDLKSLEFTHDLDEKDEIESQGGFVLMVEFTSQDEMLEIQDELSQRGLIVKVKNG